MPTQAEIIKLQRPEPKLPTYASTVSPPPPMQTTAPIAESPRAPSPPIANSAPIPDRAPTAPIEHKNLAESPSPASYEPRSPRAHRATSYAGRQLNVFIPDDLMETLEQHCFINRIGKRDAVVQALSEMLLPRAPRASSSPSPPSSPRAIYQSDDDGFDDVFIIKREYEWLTGRALTEADRAAAETLRQFSDEEALIGMLETAYNARKRNPRQPINSLAYFVTQVCANREQGIATKLTPKDYIAYLRDGLKRHKLVPETWK